MRLISPAGDPSPAALLERVERLERYLQRQDGPRSPARCAAAPGGPRPGLVRRPLRLFPSPRRTEAPGRRPGRSRTRRKPCPAAGAAQAKVALGAFLGLGPGPEPRWAARVPRPPEAKVTPERRPEPRGTQAPAPRCSGGRGQHRSRAPADACRQPGRTDQGMGRHGPRTSCLERQRSTWPAAVSCRCSNGAAVFGLPDPGLVSEGEPGSRSDTESALAAYFGRRSRYAWW